MQTNSKSSFVDDTSLLNSSGQHDSKQVSYYFGWAFTYFLSYFLFFYAYVMGRRSLCLLCCLLPVKGVCSTVTCQVQSHVHVCQLWQWVCPVMTIKWPYQALSQNLAGWLVSLCMPSMWFHNLWSVMGPVCNVARVSGLKWFNFACFGRVV